MKILPPLTPDHENASTGLWRDREVCQFTPSVEAVTQLLSYLGFRRVEMLPVDTASNTEPRRTGALRTFIAYKD